MTITVLDIMREVRNAFPAACLDGSWELRQGRLTPDKPLSGFPYVSLEGSLQDGAYAVSADGSITGVQDEAWTGRIWLLSPPPCFLQLCREIIDWAARQHDPALHSESFGAYSRSFLTPGGKPLSWQDVFATALCPYRRMIQEVKL